MQLTKIQDKPERYIVVDFQNTLWKSWMAKPAAGPDLCRADGYPTGHVYRFVRTIYKWKRDFQGELVFCYEGGEKQRYELFPTYKSGRKRDHDFDPAPDVKRLLSHIRCTELRPREAEADDAIAAFIHRKPSASHLILSSDKDLWSLRGPNVQIVSFQEMLSDADIEKSCEKHYGTAKPKSITLAKALFGDKSDGLPGIPRLLKKHVAPLLEKVETPEELLSQLSSLPRSSADKLLEHQEQVRTLYQVVRLRPEVQVQKREREGDVDKFKKFLREFESPSLLYTSELLCLGHELALSKAMSL